VKTVRELSANATLRASISYNFPAAADGAVNDNPGYTEETVFDGVNTGKWLFNVTRDGTTHAVTSFAETDPTGHNDHGHDRVDRTPDENRDDRKSMLADALYDTPPSIRHGRSTACTSPESRMSQTFWRTT
jgi:hypothetical protein